MSLIQWFVNLVRSPRDVYVPSADPFRRLDVDELRRRLRPTENGAAAGSRNLPPSDASVLDRWEADVAEACDEELKAAHHRARQGIDSLVASIRGLSSGSSKSQIQQIRDGASAQLAECSRLGRERLRTEREHLDGLETDFETFRKNNGLTRVVRQGDGGWRWAILFAMVTVEAGVNGQMFAQQSALGLLGGVTQALVFAVVNVASGAITGRFVVPQLLHRSVNRRVIGVLGVSGAAIGALALNLAVAHFRDGLGAGSSEGEAARFALERVQTLSFDLADLMSWLLFAMGSGFFIAAAVDGFGLDDPYPGYGRIFRSLRDARDSWHNASQGVRKDMARILKAATGEIDLLVRQRDVYVTQSAALKDKVDRLARDYETHVKAVRRQFQGLCDEYRDANRGSRSTPAPSHFSQHHMPPARELPLYDLADSDVGVPAVAAEAVSSLTSLFTLEMGKLAPFADAEGGPGDKAS